MLLAGTTSALTYGYSVQTKSHTSAVALHDTAAVLLVVSSILSRLQAAQQHLQTDQDTGQCQQYRGCVQEKEQKPQAPHGTLPTKVTELPHGDSCHQHSGSAQSKEGQTALPSRLCSMAISHARERGPGPCGQQPLMLTPAQSLPRRRRRMPPKPALVAIECICLLAMLQHSQAVSQKVMVAEVGNAGTSDTQAGQDDIHAQAVKERAIKKFEQKGRWR